MSIDSIQDRLETVYQEIKQASLKANRDFEPRLVAVSKTKPLELILEAYKANQRHFGENYIQELFDKACDNKTIHRCPDIKWHFIGHIQSNKVSKLSKIPNLYMVETIDSTKTASALNSSMSKHNTKLKVLVQVNTSNEAEKNGVLPADVSSLCSYIIKECPHLKFSGLMTIGKDGHDLSEGPNSDFLTLVECRKDVCNTLGLEMCDVELSMGMSNDFEHAIELGSTNVRIGSSIFGFRPKKYATTSV